MHRFLNRAIILFQCTLLFLFLSKLQRSLEEQLRHSPLSHIFSPLLVSEVLYTRNPSNIDFLGKVAARYR